jgi:hypothetical protein
MGYTTTFDGTINVTPAVTEDLMEYINKFSETRRMKRNVEILKELYGYKNSFEGNYGVDGEYFVGGGGFAGQERDRSVKDFNEPPATQPGLWCQWIINEDGEIEWDQGEKFYNAGDWMIYIIDNFLAPKGYICNGEIFARGEEDDDIWKIVVKDNKVTTVEGSVIYDDDASITLQTNAGELKAVKGTDSEYPGINVTLDGETVAIIEKRQEDKSVRTILYNKDDEDYDHIHDFDKSES